MKDSIYDPTKTLADVARSELSKRIELEAKNIELEAENKKLKEQLHGRSVYTS